MFVRVKRYGMCLTKLQEYSRALELFNSGKHDQASQYFQLCLNIFRPMAPTPSIFLLYQQRATANQIKQRNYQRARGHLNEQLHRFPEKANELFLTAHIVAALTKTRTTEDLGTSCKELQPLALAVQNIITGHEAPLITERDLPQFTFHTKCRQSTVVMLSNYLTLQKPQPQLTKLLMEPVLHPAVSYLHHAHNCTISPTDMVTDQDNLLQKLTTDQECKFMYALCYVLFNCGSYDNRCVSLWLNIFLKFCESRQKEHLYRPLYMLAVFYKNNGKPMVAEGLFNTALDLVNRKLHPDQHRLIAMSKADLIVENPKRIEEAEQLRLEHSATYSFRNVLLEMIV